MSDFDKIILNLSTYWSQTSSQIDYISCNYEISTLRWRNQILVSVLKNPIGKRPSIHSALPPLTEQRKRRDNYWKSHFEKLFWMPLLDLDFCFVLCIDAVFLATLFRRFWANFSIEVFSINTWKIEDPFALYSVPKCRKWS